VTPPPLLLKAARRLEPLNPDLAREAYLEAWGAAHFAGPLAAGDLAETSRAARALSRSLHPGPGELLLDGLALLINDGLPAAVPTLRQAASAFASDGISVGDGLRWGWLATIAACLLWDDDGLRAILARQVQLVRNAGALEHLPIYLEEAGIIAAWRGGFGVAASLIAEANAIREATGPASRPTPPFCSLVCRGARPRPSR
jgi:hypothetical protein